MLLYLSLSQTENHSALRDGPGFCSISFTE